LLFGWYNSPRAAERRRHRREARMAAGGCDNVNPTSTPSLLPRPLHRSSPADEREQLIQHLLKPDESLGGRHPHSSLTLSPAGVGMTPIERRRKLIPISHRHQLVESTREQQRRRGRARALPPA